MENSRIQILRDELYKLKLNGMIVTTKENIFYLTEIDIEGYLILSLSECIFLCLDKDAKKANEMLNIYSGVSVLSLEKSQNILENMFSENDYIAVEANSMTLKEFDNVKKIFKTNFKITDKIIEKIREVKDKFEIEKIKYICSEISKILEKVKYMLKPHVSEIEIRNEIIKRMNEKDIYPEEVRVTSGENTADISSKGSFRKLFKNDIVNIDIVGKKDKYFGEIGRTFFIGDEYKKEAYLNYEKIYKVYDNAIKILKKYNNASEIFKNLKNDLENINWNLNYYTVRSIGLTRKDEPFFECGNYENIKKGMVLTIEPQIYFDGNYGILLKDTIVITDANYIYLTDFGNQELKNIILN